MALDAATYGRVEEAEEKILNNIGEKLDPPINDIETAVEDFKEIANSLPSGVPAPSLVSISSSSNEEGIDVVLTATVKSYEQSNDSFLLSRTKGVMVRYKEDSFPVNKEDGTLAFIDTDLFTVGSNGEITPKQKTNRVVGLTNGKTYCFTAFPYSTQNVYNESAGSKNCTKCQWTGTKGTLTVNVTHDYDYKPFGEYTATLTPTAGGQAITKTQSGEATIVFSGLEAGEYTLSFSDVTSFTKPQNQSVTVVAGQSQVLDLQYHLNVNLSTLSWEEISEYGQMGVAEELFSVGDTKDDVISGETLTFEIIDFNKDDLANGSGKSNYTFGMKNCMAKTRKMGGGPQHYWEGVNYENSDVFPWLEELYNGLQADMKNAIKTVSKKVIQDGDHENSIKSYNVHLFLFSGVEVFGPNNLSTNGNVHASPLEGTQYSRFVNSASRTKKLANGTGAKTIWSLRSPEVSSLNSYCYVTTTGSLDGGNDAYGICFGFCI